MHIIHGLPDLARQLPQLPDTHWVDLPSAALQALAPLKRWPHDGDVLLAPAATQLGQLTEAFAPAKGQAQQAADLTSTGTRLLARAPDEPVRMGYSPWLPVTVLRGMAWPPTQTEPDLRAPEWQALLHTEFVRSDRFAPLFASQWADDEVPEPTWPDGSSLDAHLSTWAHGLKAMAWTAEERMQPTPATEAELRLCEWRLGCRLPASLRAYLRQLGCEDFGEEICGASGIQPLIDAYPGIEDMLDDLPADQAQAMRSHVDQLVTFGDYLGNGNLWCFHRQTAAVWYFDHDAPPPLTQLFDDVAEYLDTLAIKAQCEAHAFAKGERDGHDVAEAMLVARLGHARVRKWMY